MLERLNAPRDIASLAAFRVLFGAVLVVSIVRYFVYGWIEPFYIAPRFYFSYFGLGWLEPLPPWAMYAVFVVMLFAAVGITLGALYRLSAVVFFVLFNYVHLIDVTNYLNHYYFVALLSLILCVLPLHRAYSIDAWRRPEIRVETLPAWMIYWVRFQIAIVYGFAAMAKLGPDWLIYGQPLGIWLHARTDTPIIGWLLDDPAIALAASWAGFLYDATIVAWLSWRRSRPFAYVVVCVFHFFTHVFFQIGIFPLVMTIATLIFFDADWPRRVFAALRRTAAPPAATAAPPARWRLPALGAAALGAWVLFHLAVPLRSHVYGGDVLWHEQGMRWSWRVKVREKNGDVMYRVRMDGEVRERRIAPNAYLTTNQEREFACEPDLILQLAHQIRDDLIADGHRDVEVRADAWASLNGRPSARLIDPDVDLAEVTDSLARAAWITPVPGTDPIRLRNGRERMVSR